MPDNKCTGECLKCSFQQQVYCSAQRTYGMMENQKAIVNRLERLEEILLRFDTRDIFPLEDNAQNGSGADNKEPKNP